MATITNMTTRKSSHPDAVLLTNAAVWILARAEARAIWARYEYESTFSTQAAETKSPTAQLEQVATAESHMAAVEPLTTLGAKVLLEAAIDILQTNQRDPELNFGKGPVLEILINVARALSKQDIVLHGAI